VRRYKGAIDTQGFTGCMQEQDLVLGHLSLPIFGRSISNLALLFVFHLIMSCQMSGHVAVDWWYGEPSSLGKDRRLEISSV
jgi:hypothetical protein